MPTYRSHTEVSFAATDTFPVTKPSGVLEKERMLAFVVWRPPVADTYGVITAPSGWNLLLSQAAAAGGRVKLFVYEKLAGASEPADYTWTSDINSGTRQMRIYIGAYQKSTADQVDLDDYDLQLNSTADATAEAPDSVATVTPTLRVTFHLHGDGVTTGYFGATTSVSAGTIRGQYTDDGNGGRLIMALSDDAQTGTGTKTGTVATAAYGSTASFGVSLLLKDVSLAVTYLATNSGKVLRTNSGKLLKVV